ncbi:MAG: N-6 DNA methylase [Acidobacteria bacterium]|nr:N-6 DNA methylase [Acidobacteriota bacterium]
MIPGVTGELVSSSYLARYVQEHEEGGARPDAWARGVVRWWRHARQSLGPASPPRAMLDIGTLPLASLLGYRVCGLEPAAWGHAGVLAGPAGPCAVFISTAWGAAPERAWRDALRTSLAARLPWALVFNGSHLTLIDGSRPWTRRVLGFDLDAVCRSPGASHALWLLARADAVGLEGSSELASAVAASDRHGVDVCAALAGGVLDALGQLVAALDRAAATRRRDDPRGDARIFEQSLTVVYRLLFLLFTEARGLVPTWHRVYRQSYSMDALCQRVLEGPPARGVWATMQAMSRLAHAGCHADDLEVTAFNGRLFAPARTPLAERKGVPDGTAAGALRALATTPSKAGRERIAFHDLGVEQLGAVYERVLEYEPVRTGRALTLRPTSTDRKTTGSFYTPRAVTDFVVRRTLAPLVEERTSESILRLRVVDPAMGSGAFLVSACRFLAERAERARVAEGAWTERDITEADRAELRRTVAERCLYGVDINPTAVQLARLSLWLTTLAADRPLTFLDHHLAAGNSLIGARLADLARPPVARVPPRAGDAGHAQLHLFGDEAVHALARAVVPERLRLALDPSTTPQAVREKEQRLDRLLAGNGSLARWARAADVWCGLALDSLRPVSPGTYAEWQRHAVGLDTSLPARQCQADCERATALARRHGAIHWELVFPEVFLDEAGHPLPDAGFDAVVGNPPWEMLRGDTGDAGRRAGRRDDSRAVLRYVRASGHYPLRGRGHANQYQLFLERALQWLRPGGRFGLILPSGIQSDVGCADLRRVLLDGCQVDTWLGVDNRRGIFPIHRGVRFVLLAGTSGGHTATLPLSGSLTDAACLHRLPDLPRTDEGAVPRVRMTRDFLRRWDPAHLTIPALATPRDAAIAWQALASPPLSAPGGWGVRFGRELNATDDGPHFVGRHAGGARLPVVEGKHLRPFGIDLASVARFLAPDIAARLLDTGSSFGIGRVCYRDVASSSNRLTLIAALLPPGTVSTHTVFCTKRALPPMDAWCLVGLLNSLVANYLVRLQVTTHVTTVLMARLPVPRPGPGSSEAREIAGLAERLSTSSIEMEPESYARLNAVAARLYGLSGDEYRHIVSTFPLLPAGVRAVLLRA